MERSTLSQWVYGRRIAVHQLAERLCGPGEAANALFEQFLFHGGKAFGLLLCEKIAQADGRFSVPTWVAMTEADVSMLSIGSRMAGMIDAATRKLDPLTHSHVMVRSSEHNEDWISGESGTAASVRCKREEALARLPSVGRHQPVVVQDAIEGVGIVIDIAHSHLLLRTVTRTTTGRTIPGSRGTRYTSATWDREGLSRLWDPETGRPLTATHTGPLVGPDVRMLPLAELAAAAFAAVRAIDIPFGVELELIICPAEPERWHLVQIRPLPKLLTAQNALRPTTQSLVTTTPAVSAAFDVRGPVRGLAQKDMGWVMRIATDMLETVDDELKRDLFGRILLWERPPADDYWLAAIDGLNRLGVVGHITDGVVLINTTHGSTPHANIKTLEPAQRETWLEVNRRSAVLGIDSSAFGILQKFAHHGGVRLQIISDGLVGQIAVTE